MDNLSGWDIAILVIAAYVAIVTLVRLMRHRRDTEVARLQAQVALEQRRKRAAEQQQRQQEAVEQFAKAQRSLHKMNK